MDKWAKRSIEIANAPGYLDRLHEVYPIVPQGQRELPASIKEQLRIYYDEKSKNKLIKTLLRLEKFPIDDPYVAFLRKKRGLFIDYNPKTVERIARRIFSMGFEAIIKGVEEPKKVSRQSGALFRNWLHTLGYPFLSEQEFGSYRDMAFLQGNDGQLMDYANTILHCDLRKGIDLLAKVGENYVLAEAKFVTDYGGGQASQVKDAMRLLESEQDNATKIAILDGVIWIKDGAKMHKTVCQSEKVILSALLLKDFLEELREKED